MKSTTALPVKKVFTEAFLKDRIANYTKTVTNLKGQLQEGKKSIDALQNTLNTFQGVLLAHQNLMTEFFPAEVVTAKMASTPEKKTAYTPVV